MKQDRIDDQPLIEFDAVPRRESVGGWTPARQRAFITALAATGSVARAAAAVKMSKAGVYALRAAEGSGDFVRAWNFAVEEGVAAIKSVAFERAVDGIEEDVWYHGERRGTRTRYDNRLLATLLRLYAAPPRPPHAVKPGPGSAANPETRKVLIARLIELSRRAAREEGYFDEDDTPDEDPADAPMLPFDLAEMVERRAPLPGDDPLDWLPKDDPA